MEDREEKSKNAAKTPQNPQRRPSCGKCMKPSSVCICSRVKFPPIENSIALTILQHSLEGKHHLNSARVASLGLKNISVVPVSDVLFQAEYIIRPLDDSSRFLKSASNASAMKSVEVSGNGKSGNEFGLSHNEVLSVPNSLKELTSALTEKTVLHKTTCSSMKSVTIIENGKCQPANGLLSVHNSVTDLPSVPDEKSELHKISCSSLKSAGISGNGKSVNDVNSFKNGGFRAHNSSSKDLTSAPTEESEMHLIRCSSMKSFEISENRKRQYENGVNSKDLPSIPGEKPELYKIVCSSNMVQVSLGRTARPDLIKALPKELLESFSTNGFSVQRIQTKGKRGSKILDKFEEFLLLIPPGSALLFPGKIASDLDSIKFDVKHLILLDGTWDKARRMFHENPWLQLLPRIKLSANGESIYKEVRHQPKPGCLSTVESIVCALKVLGEDPIEKLDELLEVFESMIDDQRRLKEEKFRQLALMNNI